MIGRKTIANFLSQWYHVKWWRRFCPEIFKKVFFNKKKMASRKIFRQFLPANFFMFILLISNHTVFLVQFGINLHLWVFQKAHSCKLIPNWTRNRMITCTKRLFEDIFLFFSFETRRLPRVPRQSLYWEAPAILQLS